jgi:hypothetical protein
MALEQRHRRGCSGDREGEVHVKAPAPRQIFGERAAEQQADRGAAAGDRPPDPECLAALARLGEGGGEQ